jgi:hypothetical protein
MLRSILPRFRRQEHKPAGSVGLLLLVPCWSPHGPPRRFPIFVLYTSAESRTPLRLGAIARDECKGRVRLYRRSSGLSATPAVSAGRTLPLGMNGFRGRLILWDEASPARKDGGRAQATPAHCTTKQKAERGVNPWSMRPRAAAVEPSPDSRFEPKVSGLGRLESIAAESGRRADCANRQPAPLSGMMTLTR